MSSYSEWECHHNDLDLFIGRKAEKYHPLVAMIHTLRPKSLSIAVRTMAVKTAESFLLPGQCHAFRESVVQASFSFSNFLFSFYCGYLDNDQAEALPKLLSLSTIPSSISVYCSCHNNQECSLKRNYHAAPHFHPVSSNYPICA